MNHFFAIRNVFAVIALLFCSFHLPAQQSAVAWTASPEDERSFIENKGQFDGRNRLPDSEILFAVDQGELQIYFTKQGVSYYVERKYKNPDRKKGDRTKPKLLKEYQMVHLLWEDANPNPEVAGLEMQNDYHVYSFLKPDKSMYAIEGIRGYEKLLYRNLYPGIDAEYVFHPEHGIKYSLIVHPGADVSKVKMKYSGSASPVLNAEGKIVIPTFLGDIIEHAPVTFYAKSGESLSSSFFKEENAISFLLGSYDRSKTVVIDPWVQTPTLSNSNCVWECEKDGTGNVYIIGGDAPMRLRKYSSTGVLQWTYNTPWDTTAGDWLGTLATDLAGNSYVTNGSLAEIIKVNTSGGLVWSANGGPFDEYWSVQFNCDQTKLVVGGTRIGGLIPPPPANSYGVIFDLSTSNGSILNIARVASTRAYVINLPIIGPQTIVDINEVRAITSSRNAKYYFLTLDTIGAINQNFNACSSEPLFKVNSTFSFGYKCENYRPLITDPNDGSKAGNSGICAIRANDKFVYSQNGTTILKRSLTTGAIITSATIPGGITVSTPVVNGSINQPGNSGIDIDDCGNVYVGSGNQVVKYDADLNFITSVSTPHRVYDVTVSYNGDIIVCGATGNNSVTTRSGYVQSINMSACAPFALTCCDATICPAGPFCTTDAPVNLTRVTAGGTWSGPGITNVSTGTFNPSIAGPGTHTITYTLACGSDAITIVVNSCDALEVCIETNGQYTVSGGTGPYTWESGVPFQNCSGCFFGICSPLCLGFPDTTWTSFGTGTTVTPPGTFPIRVRDSGINELLITSAGSLQNCSTVVCPTITVNIASQTNPPCFGSTGSATASASGGATPYTYTWMPGNLSGAAQSSLAAGTYNITATDANGCTGSGSVTLTAPSALSLTTSKTDASCFSTNGTASVSASGGTAGYTYSWTTGATTSAITGLAAGNFLVTVQDANNCSATATVTISSTGGPTVSLASQINVRCNGANNGSIDITVSGGTPSYSYSWSNGATTEDISNLPPNSYTVSVTDANTCVSVLNATITEPAVLSVSGIVTDATCGSLNGSIDITATGGTTPYSYIWSTSATSEDLTGILPASYSVTVSDVNLCFDTASFIVSAPGNFSVALTPNDASCFGVADGSIASNVSGGSPPFEYDWSTGATAPNLTGVPQGTYSVTVTDDDNCTVSQTATVSAPTRISFNTSITNVLCQGGNNGGIKLSPTGGLPPYEAQWSNGDTTLSIEDLFPAVYSVTVTDAQGCQRDTSISLTSASEYTVSLVVTNASCDGSANGGVQANIINGTTAPYSYIWNTGDSTSAIANVEPGEYSVTVSDSLSCLRSDSATVMAGDGLMITEEIMDATCPDKADGAIITTVSGGTAPYSYLWNTGATTSNLININAGLYSLTVTDENDCSGSDTMLVLVDSTNADCDTLVIYDVFSPNGDGSNDEWVIDGLEDFSENELQIFNRWGSVVFEAAPYNNDWDGNSKNGEALPVATYYYILKLNNSTNSVYSGNITLIR